MADNFNFDYDLSLKASWYYYMENLTQQQISDIMGISRMRVIKLLESARHNGIIQFHFRSDHSHRMHLERELCRHWKLQDVFIVPVDSSVQDLDFSLGQAAAMYLTDQIHENCYINWGHGRTLNHTLSCLLQTCEYHLSIVSLTGGVDYYLPDSRCVYRNVDMHVIPAPLIMETPEAAQIVRKEKSVQDIFNMIWHSSITVIGIGGLNAGATLIKKGVMSSNDFLLLGMQGAVGDILSQFINKQGEKVQSFYDERMVAISLSELRKLNNVVAVAGGANKAPAIRAALSGGYINKLVTDEETAKLLLQENEEEPSNLHNLHA